MLRIGPAASQRGASAENEMNANFALLSRKDIAQMTELSVDVVRRNEANLGIAAAKILINGRLIRYRRAKVLPALRKIGFEIAE